MPSEETTMDGATEPRGVEHLPPQITFTCVDCEKQPGEEDIGGFFTYPASDVAKAIDEATYHVIDGDVVCDECAYNREHKGEFDAH